MLCGTAHYHEAPWFHPLLQMHLTKWEFNNDCWELGLSVFLIWVVYVPHGHAV